MEIILQRVRMNTEITLLHPLPSPPPPAPGAAGREGRPPPGRGQGETGWGGESQGLRSEYLAWSNSRRAKKWIELTG